MSSLSHLLPYVLFILLGLLGAELPDNWGPAMEPVRAIAVLGTVFWFFRRGAYPELAKSEARIPHATALAVAAGIAVGLLWPVLTSAVPTLGEMGRGGFDANAYGAEWAWLLLGGRLVASIVAVPFAEELLVRSLLPRWTDAGSGDWRAVAVGKFTPLSFAVSVGFFTLTHPEWLAALLTGLLWTFLLMKTGRLRDLVISHAVANAVLDAYVLLTGETMLW
jgi:CAAX prenyl protease-like protein